MGDQHNKVSRHAESLRTQDAQASKIMQLTAHLLEEQAARGRASSVLKTPRCAETDRVTRIESSTLSGN